MAYNILKSIRLERGLEGVTQAPVLYTPGQTGKTREELHPFIRDLLEQRAIEWDIPNDGGSLIACVSAVSSTLRRKRLMASSIAGAAAVSATLRRKRSMATGIACQSGVTAASSNVNIPQYLDADMPAYACDGRLTLTTGVPVTVSDVTAATTVYCTPFNGNVVALYNGSAWSKFTLTELSIAVPATTDTMYDVFVYNSSGASLALEVVAWTNVTTRATALTLQDGVYVKSGTLTKRYVGSFCTTASSGQTEDSARNRLLWNMYNRVPGSIAYAPTVPSHAYTTNTWRAWNADSATFSFSVVRGLDEDVLECTMGQTVSHSTSAGSVPAVGLGIDSTTVNSAQVWGSFVGLAGYRMHGYYSGHPGIGKRVLTLLEKARAVSGGTTTWGDAGLTPDALDGVAGTVLR